MGVASSPRRFQATAIAATQRPPATSTLTEPSGTPAWKTVPSWAVIGIADQVIPPALIGAPPDRHRGLRGPE